MTSHVRLDLLAPVSFLLNQNICAENVVLASGRQCSLKICLHRLIKLLERLLIVLDLSFLVDVGQILFVLLCCSRIAVSVGWVVPDEQLQGVGPPVISTAPLLLHEALLTCRCRVALAALPLECPR